MVGYGVVGEDQILDWDDFSLDPPDDLNFDVFDDAAVSGLSTSPDSGRALSIGDIEQYLLNDDSFNLEKEQDDLANQFFSDVLLDSLPESMVGSDQSKDSSSSPEPVEVEGKGEDMAHEDGTDAKQTTVVDVAELVDDDDPVAKKRKRQMRNRDAAVRSRERKKMYMKDLETKSKYYEAECKRLGSILQCCLAENQALRFSLHNSKAFEASMTKQESAVLLLESLLLGSLLGFLGIICLLILPSQLLWTLEMGLQEHVDNEEWEDVAPRRARTKVFNIIAYPPVMMGKRCKGSRSRMKQGSSMTSYHSLLGMSYPCFVNS